MLHSGAALAASQPDTGQQQHSVVKIEQLQLVSATCVTQQPQQQLAPGVQKQRHVVSGTVAMLSSMSAPLDWPQHLVGGAVVGAAACAVKVLGCGPPWTGLSKGSCPLAFNLW